MAKFMFYVLFNGILFISMMKVMYVGMYVFQESAAIEKIETLFNEMNKGRLEEGLVTKMKDTSISFEHVYFGYEEQLVIKDLTFSLEAGKTYALVGPSGSEKTTLAKLISGFYPLREGTIKIGAYPITEYTHKTLAKNIANVFQDARLFKASILDNVKIGRPEADKEEILQALHLAQCDEILNKFPNREDTIIGEKGVHLSGGEMQRLTIARAILKNAGLVILDEASAAADPENEYELQKALSNLMKGRTVIMIAHCLSSIKNVDEILVVENGAIIERGNHKELIGQESHYRKLQNEFAQANEWRVSR